MEIFAANGLGNFEGKILDDLAADAERRTIASLSPRAAGTVYKRCRRVILGDAL
jgi:hypothetical protein